MCASCSRTNIDLWPQNSLEDVSHIKIDDVKDYYLQHHQYEFTDTDAFDNFKTLVKPVDSFLKKLYTESVGRYQKRRFHPHNDQKLYKVEKSTTQLFGQTFNTTNKISMVNYELQKHVNMLQKFSEMFGSYALLGDATGICRISILSAESILDATSKNFSLELDQAERQEMITELHSIIEPVKRSLSPDRVVLNHNMLTVKRLES